MSATTSASPQTTDDVNAIFQGMTNAVIARQQQQRAQRDTLPPNLNPSYQPPLPTALAPQQASVIPTANPPQQSPAPWATNQPNYTVGPVRPGDPGYVAPSQSPPAQTQQGTDPRSRQPDEYRLGQPVWHPRPGEQGYTPPQQPREFAGLDTNLIRDPTGRNNPGNLRTPGGAGPGGFQRFPTMQAGIQAMQNQLLRYQDVYGRNTVAGIISLYSPPNENPTSDAIQKAAARMGVDPNQRIDLHDPETMRRLTNAILAQEQSGGGNVRQIGGLGGVQDEMRLPQPEQRFAPAQPRDFGQWGREAPGFGSNQPGAMPRQSDFGRIMTGMAPLLLGIASLALRLPLSTAVTAYGAMAKAQQNGQNLEYERNRTKFQDQLKEATAQQTLESREASDAFEQYGNNNPEGLQQELARIALRYNDPTMFRLAESGDLNRIYQLQQRRDQLNQGLTKTSKALDDERDRQAQDAAVAAMDRKWRQENPNATEDEAAIAHNEHIGEAGRAGTKDPRSAGAEKEGAEPFNVVDKETGKTTRQVRLGNNGGMFDLNGQPTTLGPNEQLGEKAGTKSSSAKPPTPTQTISQSHLDAADARTRQWVADEKAVGRDPTPDQIAIHRDQELNKAVQAGRAGGGELAPYSGPSTWPGSPNTPPPDDPDISPGVWSQALLLAQKGAPVPLGRNSPAAAAIRKAYPVAQAALNIDPADAAARSLKFDADKAAMTSVSRYFGSGQAATQMRSLNTVAGHIDLFRQYAEAMQTGDVQTATKIAQGMAVELGHPEVTDFRIASTLMADEIVRLLTNTGGTQSDRENMQKRVASYMSQGQLTGAADTVENFMHSRFEGLQTEWVHPPGVTMNERQQGERTAQFREMMTPDARKMFEHGLRPIAGGDVPAMTEEQYNAAPSGTRYRMPNDNTIRVKP